MKQPHKVVWVVHAEWPHGCNSVHVYLTKRDAMRAAELACGGSWHAECATVTRYVRDDATEVRRVKT